MTGRTAERLKELCIQLPAIPQPIADYTPFIRTENLVFVSGQIPFVPGGTPEFIGTVSEDTGIERAQKAARIAAINVLAVLHTALDGDLDRVQRVVKITGFVNAAPGFSGIPEVINGASELFVDVFGETGRHARAAIGASALPRNALVEIDAIFEVT